MRAATLRDLLQHARRRADARVSFADDEGALDTFEVGELADTSERLAGAIAPTAAAGDLVVLALAEPRVFLPVFWACQLRGLVPVPLAPPLDDAAPLARAWEAWGRPVVVTDARVIERAPAELARAAQVGRALIEGSLERASRIERDDDGPPTDRPHEDGLALVQPSSGTTGRPRGVQLSHRNLVENVRQIADRLSLGPTDTVLSWMPLFHDMGLIATHLASLAAGAHQVWMTPSSFFRRPEGWLRLATDTGATILTGTNTSLRLLGRRLDDDALARADLSAVRRFLVGAEPISPRVLRDVEERLATAGLPPGALGGSYGLAEASVGVALEGEARPARVHRCARAVLATVGAAVTPPDDDASTVEVLEIGRPLDDVDLRIADDEGRPLPPLHVGHVEVRGPNVTRGYLFDDDATEAARRGDGFWRTGDLGFVSPDGALTVCGRVKELLFAGGRNLYADDVEELAREVAGVKRAVATWATAADGDSVQGVFLVVEPGADGATVVTRTREHLARRTGLALDVVELIAPSDIPRTTSGKVQRGHLGPRLLESAARSPSTSSDPPLMNPPATRDEWEALVQRTWAGVLGRAVDEVPLDVSFASLGGSSVSALEVQGRLEAALGVPLDHEVLLSAPTVRALAARLSSSLRRPAKVRRERAPDEVDEPIAIVGVACRLPLGDSPEAFWRALLDGENAIRSAPPDRWRRADAADLPHAKGSWLDDPWAFDSAFFGLPRDDARRTDPQQRVFLEVAAEGLERAGLGAHRRAELAVGVFAGAASQPYLDASLAPWQRRAAFDRLLASDAIRALSDEQRRELERAAEELAGDRAPHAATLAGNLTNLIAGRVAHVLDLRGPALVVDTACSSSLVAVHLACESLRRGECDVALAGGVALHLTPHVHRAFHAAGALSRAGACRPFSSAADGIVPGEGAAVVVLEPLSRARANGRQVWAVLRGSAVNNDGRSLGIMAPNPEGQRAVLGEAYRRALLPPERVSLVEAHGTGTLIGDPVEVRALADAFGSTRERAIGSVKANLGHLMAAAGIAGLVKTTLALRHRTLPPAVAVDDVNARLELAARKLRLPRVAEPWNERAPRVAGVSAFGFGGTNCHVVVEEAEELPSPSKPAGPSLLLLSAPTHEHLGAYAADVAARVEAEPSELPGIAAALCGRTHHRFRVAATVGDDVSSALGTLDETARAPNGPRAIGEPPRIALLFPGQGSQHVQQARGLLERWPSLRARTLELLDGVGARAAFEACWGAGNDEALRRTDVAQPLLFAFQVSLVEALARVGVKPAAVLGHSVGEIAALACAGVLDVEATLRWVHERGRVMQAALPAGVMAAALAPEDVVAPLIAQAPERVGIAAANGPRQTVIAGEREEVQRVCRSLHERGVVTRLLPVAHAFHSPLVEALLPALHESLPRLAVSAPRVDVVSTVLAAPLAAEDVDHDYLVAHARQPVRFAAALHVLAAREVDAFVEVGPGDTLTRLTRALLAPSDERAVVSLCRGAPGEASEHDDTLDVRATYEALASLYVRGVDVDLGPLEEVTPSPHAPLIPWRRERLRLDEEPAEETPSRAATSAVVADRRVTLRRRVFGPAPSSSSDAFPQGTVRLVAPPGTFRDAVVDALSAEGRGVVLVESGERGLARVAEDRFQVELRAPAALGWLLEGSAALSSLWLLDEDTALDDVLLRLGAWQGACATLSSTSPLLLLCRARPALSSALHAAAAGLRAEGVNVSAMTLPVDAPHTRAALRRALDGATRTRDSRVLPSGEIAFARFEDVDVDASATEPRWDGKGFVVLGGSGGVGGALARALARRGAARVVLVGRRARERVAPLLEELHALGASTAYLQGDVRERDDVERALASAIEGGLPLGGVVHAAGAAQLGSLSGRAREALDEVVAPKQAGGDVLAEALAGRSYDFVALISSVTTVDPRRARGLVDYAAANAYLEGLAEEQRAAGRPWTALAYPAWGATGLAASLDGPVGDDLDDESAVRAFEAALHLARSSADATLIVGEASAATASEARFDTFEGEQPGVTHPPIPTAARRGEEADLEAFLLDAVARAVRRAPSDVDVNASLVRLGLDSLAAVDIVRKLEERVGRKLSLTLLLEHDTIAKVVAHLERTAAPPPAEPIVNASEHERSLDGAPLLPAQQTFFANHGLLPALPGYVFVGVDLDGPLSPAELERALALVWARHPVLHCGFGWRDGRPAHLLRDGTPPAIAQHDLRGLSDDEQREQALAIEHALRNRPFDLEQPPLGRVVLLRRAERRWSLLLTLHHIAADAWSAHRLLDELLELHARRVAGDDTPLPPLATGFADVARALADDADAEDSRRFWERVLADPPAALRLPFDGDPEAEPTGPCEIHQVTLTADELDALRRVARHAGVGVFDTVLASYAHALRRWSGSDDVIVRVANARREVRLLDIERVVGCFADSLPVRLDTRAPDLLELARRARSASLGAMRHPFTSSLALAALAPRSRGGPRGLTPAGLSFPSFRPREQWGELHATGMRGGAASGFTQLGLIAWESSTGLTLSWSYTQPLFRPSTIARLAAEHLDVLRGLARGAAPGVPPPSRRPLPSGAVLHERLRESAERVPERTAVVDGARALSYAELHERAARVASVLQERGVTRGALVGVLARPGADALVGVVGALSSGAAYVPADPDYPDERVRRIFTHAGVRATLATSDQLPRLLAAPPKKLSSVILLDDGPGAAPPPSSGVDVLTWRDVLGAPLRSAPASVPDDLAYVMYTSGTTGAPKGVMVTHDAVSRFHDWVHDAFEIVEDDRFIQTSALSFGGSIRQMFSPLLAGASVFPVARDLLRDPSALVRFLDERRITLWNSVPTLWRRLLEALEDLDREGAAPSLDALRWILIGGEEVPADLPRRWRARFGTKHRVANLYGSTETVVNATWWEIGAGLDDGRHVPIGAPRAGSRVEVLDDDGVRPTPAGEVGELYVGGPSLSRGYLHEPELTARAFVRLPDGGVAYRTGDLVRALPGGALVYVGRRDTLVKVRGNRVELGEIEAVLREDERVRQACVVEWRRGNQQRLFAFLEPSGARSPDEEAIRRRIAAALPDYMMPHRFAVLARLPLTPAGKIDRRALLSRLGESPDDERGLDDERGHEDDTSEVGALERAIAAAFAEVLEVPSVPPDGDFFLLGGDSILALDVVRRLRAAGVSVPRPMLLYAERTPRALARGLRASSSSAPLSAVVSTPLQGINRAASDLPLLPAQRGFLVAHAIAGGRAPLLGARVPLRGEIHFDVLRRAVDRLTERHAALRTSFPLSEGARRQRVVPQLSLPLTRLSAPTDDGGAELQSLLDASFDLEKGPLVRLALLSREGGAHTLVCAAHHAVLDAVSLAVLSRDLVELYDAELRGRGASLPPLTSTPLDIAEAHDRPSRASDLEWWSERFSTPVRPLLPMTQELPGAPAPTPATRRLSSASSRALDEAAESTGHSPAVLVLTAYARVLARTALRPDVVVGVARSGRELPLEDAPDLVGCFAAGVPVRVDALGGTFASDLEACAASFREHLAHADVSPDELARVLPRDPTTGLPVGSECFLSVVDLRRLALSTSPGALALDLEEVETTFAAEASGSRAFLVAKLGRQHVLTLHARLDDAARDALLDEIARELESGVASLASPSKTAAPRASGQTCDAAIVGYLPSPARLAALVGGDPAEVRERARALLFPNDAPRIVEVTTTAHGRSAAVVLPLFADELSSALPTLPARIADAAALARRHGARVVSLAGLLPSLTGYGLHVTTALERAHVDVRLTTGHAATACAVVGTTLAALRASGRDLGALHLGVLGYGSIGQAAVRLLVEIAGAPRALTVLELAARVPTLERPLAELRRAVPEAQLLVSTPEATRDIDVLLCATSGGGLDVAALRPGTLVIDDSFPPALDVDLAWPRVARGELFAVDGGRLGIAGEPSVLVDDPTVARLLSGGLGPGMPGCRAESLLLGAHPDLPVTLGLPSLDGVRRWWERLAALAVGAAPFALHGRPLPAIADAGLTSTVSKVMT